MKRDASHEPRNARYDLQTSFAEIRSWVAMHGNKQGPLLHAGHHIILEDMCRDRMRRLRTAPRFRSETGEQVPLVLSKYIRAVMQPDLGRDPGFLRYMSGISQVLYCLNLC
nr:hypothetical protein CFP56_37318 [Quercus suber]